uniref:Uncharacterized protein n=1 Tax=Anguilla anguilla TaxID=7936 RepID=A0A0E9WHJ8_ANGAN
MEKSASIGSHSPSFSINSVKQTHLKKKKQNYSIWNRPDTSKDGIPIKQLIK